MKATNLFQGRLVRLVAPEPKKIAPSLSRWGRDSEYARLLDSDPPRLYSVTRIEKWLEKELQESRQTAFLFMIHTLADDRTIGFVELDGIQWIHGEGFLGIGIGERQDWNQGYGTDAMQVILKFAFSELNLHRVTLNVFEFNARAIRVYEKVGFQVEGRQREALHKDGRRWDLVYMGLLREDWEKRST